MSLPLWFAVFAAANCAPVDGWNAGRGGRPPDAACVAAGYAEAHKLGDALHALVTERAAIEAGLGALATGEQARQRRRQRQIDNDVEAIHGVATIKGWPYEGAPAPGAMQ
jgi:hypothetical protein